MSTRLKLEPNISDDEWTALALATPCAAHGLNGRAVMKVMVRAPDLVSLVSESE